MHLQNTNNTLLLILNKDLRKVQLQILTISRLIGHASKTKQSQILEQLTCNAGHLEVTWNNRITGGKNF
jgi:hypothetical protein